MQDDRPSPAFLCRPSSSSSQPVWPLSIQRLIRSLISAWSSSIVVVHFAPHPQNVELRIRNYARLSSYLRFPSQPLSGTRLPLYSQLDDSDHVFFLGDINYRLGETTAGAPPAKDELVTLIQRLADEGQGWSGLTKWDTLSMLQSQGKTLGGFLEAKIDFAPTYKKVVGKVGEYRFVHFMSCVNSRIQYLRVTANVAVFGFLLNDSSRKRTPAYTDRILFSSASSLACSTYTSISRLTLSDHSPVVLTATIPAPKMASSTSSDGSRHRNIQIYEPVSDFRIDLESWLSWALDRTVGLAWLGLLLLGAGRGVGVGAGVLVALLVFGWYLA